ncbi:hypothetical protein AMTR_s00102p00100280 [Amborella trichopoda]|uniref:Uncharacterized protein n=1 Tax=Amborella trichopoda TaxID=13333 RepID=W1P0S2_AMBTC|nr:hypothetical protein AMTR_s00102p00100280 [Amborella trichopoda]
MLAHRTSYAIILVGNPRNSQKMGSMLSTTTITVAELPFSSTDHGLPASAESTDVMPSDLLLPSCKAVEAPQPALKRLLSESPRSLCLIVDAVCGWTVSVAEELDIFHASFSTCRAFGTSLWEFE